VERFLKFGTPFMKKITNFTRSREFSSRIHDLIPGGAHTYSKGDDQFPLNSPAAITHGKGAHVWDLDGNEFIDCSMGLTSVCIGHGYEPVAQAVSEAAFQGSNFQRPALMELEAAKLFLETVESGDMVKFAKNGSTVTTAAVKLARAYTGRNRVAIAREHNFFSYDDWFIATTPADRGIPAGVRTMTAAFSYNDYASVEALLANKNHDIACLIMEPVKFDPPRDNFLHKVAALCKERGVVFVLDEMISGFKWSLKGAQNYFGVKPDLATWGKGIANGFSACALTGRAEIMELGGIRREGDDKLFLISTTHGAETIGLAAMISTIQEFKKHNMIESNWQRGTIFQQRLEQIISRHGLSQFLQPMGYACLLALVCRNSLGTPDDSYRTLMMQEMITRGVLFQGLFYTTWSHQQDELDHMATAFDQACAVYRAAIDAGGCEGLLVGRPAKPVFRKKI
jgi:glutamate-1-semialdehyde 2,1-aminomutase